MDEADCAGKGSLAYDAKQAAWLSEHNVRLVEGDYADSGARVAHADAAAHVWCVMRNRWFVIAEWMARHAAQYRYVPR